MNLQGPDGFFIKLNLSDFKIDRVKQDNNGQFHIHGSCTAQFAVCTNCHSKLTQIHSYTDEVSIEHLAIFDQKVWIHVKWPRFYCPNCDKKIQYHPDWLGATGRMTVDLENFLLRQLVHVSIRDVALKFRITEHILEGLLERRINTHINWINYFPRIIGMDEVSVKKGQGNYLTIVSDLSIPGKVQIITVLRGRSESEVFPFLKRIPLAVVAQIEAICVDMGSGYQSTLKMWLSKRTFNQLVTIDRFHVARLLGDKIDIVRKAEIRSLKKTLKSDPNNQRVIEGTQWLFRKHPKDLSTKEYLKLQNLFLLSPKLKTLHELREDFFMIFETADSIQDARKKLRNWCKQAKTTQHKSIITFVKAYREHETTILNYFKKGYNSGAVEGMNNKIKLIKRMGFGYTNLEHFIRRLFLDFNYASLYVPELPAPCPNT
jgi:transposase